MRGGTWEWELSRNMKEGRKKRGAMSARKSETQATRAENLKLIHRYIEISIKFELLHIA